MAIHNAGSDVPCLSVLTYSSLFATTREVGKGTRQGLAGAHNMVVNKHGGKIRLEIEVVQETTFYTQLPIKLMSA